MMAQQAVDSMKSAALFDKMNRGNEEEINGATAKPKKKANIAKENDDNMDEYFVPHDGEGDGHGSKKRLSVERIYQKKTQLEHILLRPDTYIGSVETVTQPMWVLNEDMNLMVQREITYVPGLYKIFDEILVNASDNKQRDPKMNTIKIDIDITNNKIRIWNNGRGIPVVEHKEHKMFVPTMIFGHLLTSSNYDDTEKKVTGGRNGYGAKLCNIFSKKFIVETSYKELNKGFKQTWQDNMLKTKEPTISTAKGEDFTAITFYPDLEKFKMEKLDKDTVDLFTRRAFDIASATKDLKVFLNGKKVPVKSFKDYVNLYIKETCDEAGAPIKLVHEVVNNRWEVAVAMSDKGFQQASFVNGIATTKGGRHIDHVSDQVVKKLIEVVTRRNKGGVQIKPFQVKNHLWLFVNCLIENPTFDSQTKENMTLQAKSFGSKCPLSEKFIAQVSKCGIVESIQSWMKFKAQSQLKKVSGGKQNKLKGIPKLDDANDAGTKNSMECTLILTEGDSAKTLAVAGLSVVGRDRYGVFPLRGKVLNVREASHKQIMENSEITNVVKIMGLQFNKKYEDIEQVKTLRYGKLMIMTDQDQDGSHIKGLLINFLQHFWPNLLKHNVVNQFITPIVKVTKGKEELSFYSLPEFEEWKNATSNWNTWKIKYYKGLGTSTSKEAKEYFTDMNRHKIDFRYMGTEDDASINLAFNKKKVDERKEWLSNWMEEKKRRAEMGLPALYLYGKNTKSVTFNDFINRELILFSNMDLERSIPSLVDGLKPGQRKVLFTCLKRNLVNKEIKVAQLAGSVAELSAYHHGEVSLMGTIIGLAQNFVGSNNLNLLQPLGQFGTRLHGGKDASSPRYIFTMLSTLTRILYNVNDEPLLNFQYDDNLRIEPEWYCPIIPMILVNGAEGIGTGWSTKIPNYDIREIVANLKRLIDGDEPLPMLPSYKNFKGSIAQLIDHRYVVNGEISIIDDQTVEITELPIRKWTQDYKEDVIEAMMNVSDKSPQLITDYKEYHTDTSVKFVVKMTSENLAKSEDQGLHKVFKLQNMITTSSMVLFDHSGCIKRYNDVIEILREFFELRTEMYIKRKDYLEGMLAAESLRYDNIARFIMEKIEGTVTVENKKKKDLIDLLVRRGYDSDPVKAWKNAQNKGKDKRERTIDEDLNNDDENEDESGPDFNYILSMPLWNLTMERKDELLGKRDSKAKELSDLRRKTPTCLWKDDLEQFLVELDKVEEKEREDDAAGLTGNVKKVTKGKRPRKVIEEIRPSPMGVRVVPMIDSIKKKAEGTKKNKDKKDANKNGKILDFMKMEDEDSNEPLSLADRLKLKGSPVDVMRGEKKEVKKAAVKREPKEKKEPKAPSPRKASISPKKKKRNPWSDDSEATNSDMSDNDMDGSFLEAVVIPRDGPRRAAAAKRVTYAFDNDENESDIEAEIVNHVAARNDDKESYKVSDSGDDSDFTAAVKKPKPTSKQAAAPKKRAIISDDDDDGSFKMSDDSGDNSDYAAPEKSKPAAKKAAAPKKKAIVKDDDSDDDDDSFKISDDSGDNSDYAAPEKSKPAAKTPKKAKAAVIDSDSDFDDGAGGGAPPSKDEKDDEWLRITGQMPEKYSQDTESVGSTTKTNSEPIMFDDSDLDEAAPPNEELFKPVKPLKADKKPVAKKPVAKKPAGEKKSRAPLKKKADKKDNKQPAISAAFAKSTAAIKSKKTVMTISDDSEDDDGDHVSSALPREPKEKKTAMKKKRNPWDSDDDSEDEKPIKKAAKKRPAKMDSDFSDMSDAEVAPKKSKPAPKKKKAFSDEDHFSASDMDEDFAPSAAPAARGGGGRSRATVKYNFGESESEDEFD